MMSSQRNPFKFGASHTRFQKPRNDNEDNPKKLEHMKLIDFYLGNKEMIEQLWNSLNEEERAVWAQS